MRRATDRLWRALRLAIGRGIVTLVDDAAKLQAVQLEGLPDEVLDGVERFQQYGFTSHPHPGAEALLVALGGQRQHSVVVAVDDRRHRVTELAEGEVAVHTSQDAGTVKHRVHLKDGLVTELHAGRSSIILSDSEIRIRAGGGAWITLDGSIAGDGTRIRWG